ncbi:MAG TPA: ABC transporter ATP-binding protein [Devosia sp.]|nr:ABC transporter ATP-binding protein [Devosia sp.]
MTAISLDHIGKRFGALAALDDVTLDFPEGSFTALLGPSGCGKTTLLRLVAGFEAPTAGEIRFGGTVVATPARQAPPEKRGVGVVFQSYALWPHMDVAGNVGYPLKTLRLGAGEIGERVGRVLELVGLAGFERRAVDELSGGQRQRVALARCLVAGAKIILFDEPLANLDVHLRASMLAALRDIRRRVEATIIYVTHDQAEALALADRIAVFDRGRLQQLGSPQQIYAEPANAMVAGFVGRGSLVTGQAVEGKVDIAGYRFAARGPLPASGAVSILLRPEALAVAERGIPVTVADVTYKGPSYEIAAQLEEGEVVTFDLPEPAAIGSALRLSVSDAWTI